MEKREKEKKNERERKDREALTNKVLGQKGFRKKKNTLWGLMIKVQNTIFLHGRK